MNVVLESKLFFLSMYDDKNESITVLLCPRGRGLVSKRLRSCVKEAVNFYLKFREENRKTA